MTVTPQGFGLRPRLRLWVGGLGLAVTTSQSRNQTEPGVWATGLSSSLLGHSDPHNMSLYQMAHGDILSYIKKSCWLPTYLIFSEIYQNTPRYTTVYGNICITFRRSNWIPDICIYNKISCQIFHSMQYLITSNISNFFWDISKQLQIYHSIIRYLCYF